MSVLEADWRRLKESAAEDDDERDALRAEAEEAEAVSAARRPARTGLVERTFRRFS
jgi:hypothetical protein